MSFDLFSTDGFPPRWLCGTEWAAEPGWGWVHVFSDLLIFVSYFSIPLAFLYLAKKRGDIPLRGLVALTAVYYFACGLSHGVDALIFWYPVYKLHGVVKLVTAIVSTVVAIILIRNIPTVLQLKGPRQLQAALDAETRQLQSVNIELSTLNEQVRESEEKAKRAAAALRDAQLWKNLALSSGQMGTWYWDVANDRLEFDDAELKLLGITHVEQIPSAAEFLNRVHPDEREALRETLQRCVREGDPYDTEFRFHNGKQYIWLSGRGEVLRDGDGGIVAMVGVNGDITLDRARERLLEEQTVAAENANNAKSEFLANMSHEIRTPLAAILGCADLLLPKLESEEVRGNVQMIRRQGRLLNRLLNDVLDLSRIEAGRLEIERVACRPRRLFDDVASLLRVETAAKGIDLQVRYDDSTPEFVLADPLRVRQVVLNLTHNAVKFTDEGFVRLEVALEADAGPPVEGVNGEPIGKRSILRIRVIDSGPGIPPESLEAIFKAFSQGDGSVTRRHGGSGLGLAISQHLVRLMEGTIEVASKVGEGSEFVVQLPVDVVDEPAARAAEDDGRGWDVAATSGDRVRVLVAEDTAALQFLLREMLQPVARSVEIVNNGQEAVEAVKSAEERGEPFDIVLMDVQMPIMDGLEATRRIRRGGFDRPIYALTAGVMASDVQQSLNAGCTGHLSKPIDAARLKEALSSAAQAAI